MWVYMCKGINKMYCISQSRKSISHMKKLRARESTYWSHVIDTQKMESAPELVCKSTLYVPDGMPLTRQVPTRTCEKASDNYLRGGKVHDSITNLGICDSDVIVTAPLATGHLANAQKSPFSVCTEMPFQYELEV
jgi:hypothetical protein